MKRNFNIPNDWSNMAKIFMALGDPNRQHILLLFEKDESITAGQIAAESSLARTTISHHLKVLKDANILSATKKHKEIWYHINKDIVQNTLENCLDYIKNNI